jgi:thymidylate synthase (FAD)
MIEATYVDHMGSDLSVVNAARVSFGKKSEWEVVSHSRMTSLLDEVNLNDYTWVSSGNSGYYKKLAYKDVKLIKYLAKHKHISPFGHAFASFHVKAPIFVARQLVKHKFLRWNEISRRYVDDEPEFYVPDVWRGRSADKKQGSSDEAVDVPPFEDYYVDYQGGLHIGESSEHNLYCLEYYKHLLDAGVAPEQARMVLPQSTMTEWYWSGSLDAFADMCRLRLPSDTQQETRVVAQQISEKMSELFPVSWAALIKGETE